MEKETTENNKKDDIVVNDYTKFVPRDYLQEYYAYVGSELGVTLSFLAKAYRNMPSTNDLILLEVGGGPAVHQLLSAAPHVKEIHFSEYLDSNLDEVKKWVRNDPDAFDWSTLTEAVLKAEGITPTRNAITEREQLLRSKISKIIHCDTLQKNVIDINDSNIKYDIVSTSFVIECIASDRQTFIDAFANIISYVKPGGAFLIIALKGAQDWPVEKMKFVASYILEEDVIEQLIKHGFSKEKILMETCPPQYPGYEGVMYFMAYDKQTFN